MDGPITPDRPQFNLIAAARSWIKTSPLQYTFTWVESHLDDKPADRELTRLERLNIEMDENCKAYWHTHQDNRDTFNQVRVSGEPWTLWLNNAKVLKDFNARITAHTSGIEALLHWGKKRIPHRALSLIDWDAVGKAMKSAKRSHRHRVSKHTAGFCGVGKVMKRRKEWKHSKCPRCDEPVETVQHVYLCRGEGTRDQWSTSLDKLRTWMEKNYTHPELARAIISGLRALSRGHTFRFYSDYPDVEEVVAEQSVIGWTAVLEGRLSFRWKFVQQDYYEWLGRRNTRERWVSALITKLWEVAWDLWDHRNKINNKKDGTKRQRNCDDDVRELYALGSSGLERTARHLFRVPLAHS